MQSLLQQRAHPILETSSVPNPPDNMSSESSPWAAAIVEHLPDAIFIVDEKFRIKWANKAAQQFAPHGDGLTGKRFYRDVFRDVTLLKPDYFPLTIARDQGRPARTILRTADSRVFDLYAVRMDEGNEERKRILVVLKEITSNYRPLERLRAIHEAGRRLVDIAPGELIKLTAEERKQLLKNRVLAYLEGVLQFNVFEIRLIDFQTNKLVPFISEGMSPEAAARELTPAFEGQGITGYVAKTGVSYLCEDTRNDSLYLQGTANSRSSLTVPLIRYSSNMEPIVIGTVNIESPVPRAFTHDDRLFLEIFCRDLVTALNMLELIEVEQTEATLGVIEKLHRALAIPVNELVSKIVATEASLDPDAQGLRQALREIGKTALELKDIVHAIGRQLPPTESSPLFANKRILVVDGDESVLQDAHEHLPRWGCVVETATTGKAGLQMAVMAESEGGYDAILGAYKLPDMTGLEFFQQLKAHLKGRNVPFIMMVPIGRYLSDHQQVKARQLGAKCLVGKYPPPEGQEKGGHLALDPLKSSLAKLFAEQTRPPASAAPSGC